MRNLMKLVALVTMMAGCQTTYKIVEPERTEYYAYCLMNGLHVTTCECVEAKAVKDTGITSITTADADTQQTLINAIRDSIKECNEATQALLDGQK